MKLAVAYTLNALREKVFAALTDPAVIQRCIDVCEKMVKTSDDCYDVHLQVGVAGSMSRYVGKLQLKDQRAPESFTLIMEIKAAPGSVKATARVTLTALGDHTELHCDTDAQVGGLLAFFGQNVMEDAAK